MDKEIIQIGEMVYTDIQNVVRNRNLLSLCVIKMLRENIIASEVVRYYICKNEKKQLKFLQRKALLKEKGKMPEPQRAVVMGQEYESKENVTKVLGSLKNWFLDTCGKQIVCLKRRLLIGYEKKRKKQFEFRGKTYKAITPIKAYGGHRNMLH